MFGGSRWARSCGWMLDIWVVRARYERHPADWTFTGMIVLNRGVLRHRANKALGSGLRHSHSRCGRWLQSWVLVFRVRYGSRYRLEHFLDCLAQLAFRIEHELT